MILEKRANRQRERRVHLKQQAEEKAGGDNEDNKLDKVDGKDKDCTGQETEEGHGGKKSVHNKTDHPGTRPVIAKPVAVQEQAQPAIGRSSPATSPIMAKMSYNPITHVSSEPYLK